MHFHRLQKTTALFIAILAACALWIQADFYLAFAQSQGLTGWKGLERFFSYFTVLSNLLATLTLLAAAAPQEWSGLRGVRNFLAAPATRAACVVYLGVVALIFAVLLAHLRVRTGWEAAADFCLHKLVPLLYALHWLAFTPRGRLRAIHALWWLAWPAVYLSLILARGALEGRYPYPFLDAGRLGYALTLRNCLGVSAVFLILSLALWSFDRMAARRGVAAH